MKPVRDTNSEPGSPVLWQKHQWQMKSKTSFFYTELHKDYLVQIIFERPEIFNLDYDNIIPKTDLFF